MVRNLNLSQYQPGTAKMETKTGYLLGYSELVKRSMVKLEFYPALRLNLIIKIKNKWQAT